MQVTKTTHNFAKRRGFSLAFDTKKNLLTISTSGTRLVTYHQGNTGWYFRQNIALSQAIKEELPYWLENELQLRQMIHYVAQELDA